MRNIYIYLLGIILCSCEPLEVLDPPYCNHWWIKNHCSQEIVVLANVNKIGGDGQNLSFEMEHRLPIGDSCIVYSNYDNLSKELLFTLMTTNVNSIAITNIDKSFTFIKFDNETNNALHSHEDNLWEYMEFTNHITNDYCQLFKWWTFTITDEDIGVVE